MRCVVLLFGIRKIGILVLRLMLFLLLLLFVVPADLAAQVWCITLL